MAADKCKTVHVDKEMSGNYTGKCNGVSEYCLEVYLDDERNSVGVVLPSKKIVGLNFWILLKRSRLLKKKDDIIFSSGCLIHAYQHLESAIAIDFSRNTIYAAIYRKGEETKYFNETKSKMPESINVWTNCLSNLNDNK